MQDHSKSGFISSFACKPLENFLLPFQRLLEEFPVLNGADIVPDLGSFESENVFRTALLFWNKGGPGSFEKLGK